MRTTININGKEVEIELTQEQVDKLGLKKEVKKWEDLEWVSGFYVSTNATIETVMDRLPTHDHKNVFATKNQARSARAMAQLSQILKHVNGDWVPDWTEGTQKYTIVFDGGDVYRCMNVDSTQFLAFPTADIRDKFLENHRELIEEYFLMYKWEEV